MGGWGLSALRTLLPCFTPLPPPLRLPLSQVATFRDDCAPCPSGAWSNAVGNAPGCYSCPAGTHFNGTGAPRLIGFCRFCERGTYAYERSAECTPLTCGPGYYALSYGAQSPSDCAACPAGFSSDAVGALYPSTCRPCAANYFSPLAGSAVCTPCAADYVSSAGATVCSAVPHKSLVVKISERIAIVFVLSLATGGAADVALVGDIAVDGLEDGVADSAPRKGVKSTINAGSETVTDDDAAGNPPNPDEAQKLVDEKVKFEPNQQLCSINYDGSFISDGGSFIERRRLELEPCALQENLDAAPNIQKKCEAFELHESEYGKAIEVSNWGAGYYESIYNPNPTFTEEERAELRTGRFLQKTTVAPNGFTTRRIYFNKMARTKYWREERFFGWFYDVFGESTGLTQPPPRILPASPWDIADISDDISEEGPIENPQDLIVEPHDSLRFQSSLGGDNGGNQVRVNTNGGGCFPLSSTVGVKRVGSSHVSTAPQCTPLSELRTGDLVRSVLPDGSLGWSPVVGHIHRAPLVLSRFLALHTQSGATLRLSPLHFLPAAPGDSSCSGGYAAATWTAAEAVAVGDGVWVVDDGAGGGGDCEWGGGGAGRWWGVDNGVATVVASGCAAAANTDAAPALKPP